MWIRVSCPGVVKFFGEHAVVYGYHAIAVAIDSRVEIYARPLDSEEIVVNSESLGVNVKFRSVDSVDWNVVWSRKLMYIFKAIELAMNYVNSRKGIEIHVKSDLPVSAGLGTSAAVSVATISAYLSCHNYDLNLNEVSKLGYRTELEVQGTASRMDTTVTTYGGAILIKEDSWRRIEIPEIPVIIGYVERKYSTKDMVLKVKKLRDNYPEIIEHVFRSIDAIVLKALECMRNDNSECIIHLMNMNQKLLEVLGICSEDMSQLLDTLRKLGVGCKVTGAGGNGCFIIYTSNVEIEKRVVEFLKEKNIKIIRTRTSNLGLQIEKFLK